MAYQALTKQLRRYIYWGKENGVRPILRINKSAKITDTVKNSGIEIQRYSVISLGQFETVEVKSNEKLSTKDINAIKDFIKKLETSNPSTN